MTQRYNLSKIRELLDRSFSEQELRDFCFYESTFRSVYEELPTQTGKKQIIRQILDFAEKKQLLETVLNEVKDKSPKQFEVYEQARITQIRLSEINPYRGLAAFREEDAQHFFGRETKTDQLVTLVQKNQFVTVLGASGSGKSSLVFAGLKPELHHDKTWLIVSFRPKDNPFRSLAAAFVPFLEVGSTERVRLKEIKNWTVDLEQGELALTDLIGHTLEKSPEAKRVLLIVDQFEELYTLCLDLDIRRRFIDALIETCISPSVSDPIHLILTLRADYLEQALNYRPFADALETAREIKLGPMTTDEIRMVIEKPARVEGVAFEPGLIERMLADVQNAPGSLPLLEFALATLWVEQMEGKISHHAYKAIGRVEGALSRHADETVERLSDEEQDRVHQVFLRLVQPGETSQDTRRLAYRDEITDSDWALIQRLASERLVVTDRGPDQRETVEVVHEALINSWERLQKWVERDRQFLVWRKALGFHLDQWQANEKEDAALLRGGVLEVAETWLSSREADLAPSERNFIKASQDLRDHDEEKERATQRKILILEIKQDRKKNLRGVDLSKESLKNINLERANLKNANLSQADLQGANLRGANLSRASLKGANLIEADLARAYLNYTDLSEADLNGSDLRAANLSWAILKGAILREADLDEADLTGSNLRAANLSWANMSKTNLNGANLSSANLSEANLSGANLKGANLKGANLWKAHLAEVDLSEANLQTANLREARLTEANLSGANLNKTDLSEADLTGANLNNVDLSEANLWRVYLKEVEIDDTTKIAEKWLLVRQIVTEGALGQDLSYADLSGSDLGYANLSGVNLSGANLSGADLSEVTLRSANLKAAKIDKETQIDQKWRLIWQIVTEGAIDQDLSQADLSEANLQGANLQGANLQGKNLSEANLSGANLHKADLTGANLSGAYLKDANLHQANLSEATLDKANFSGADLNEANLWRVDLRGVQIDDTTKIAEKWRLIQQIVTEGAVDQDLSQTDLSGANLRNVNLSKANLTEANLTEANLQGTDLSEAILTNANLHGADLSEANLRRVYIKGVKIDDSTKIAEKWRLIQQIVTEGAVDQDLSQTDLSGANLRNVNLSKANLTEANLSKANLQGADLSEANLWRVDLRGVQIDDTTKIAEKWRLIQQIVTEGAVDQDLSQADLNGANLTEANFAGANLTEANLTEADLSRANLSRANLSQTNLAKANLSEANLNEANLDGANLRETNLSTEYLTRVNLREAHIEDTSIINDKWRQVWQIVTKGVRRKNLHRIDLADTYLSKVDMSQANLGEANFRNANLKEADLSEANLNDTNLGQADLSYANLTKAQLQNAYLSESNLTGTNLSEAALVDANLIEANLTGTNLTKADLRGAELYSDFVFPKDSVETNSNRAILIDTNLTNTIYNSDTIWPPDFDPVAAGAILVEE